MFSVEFVGLPGAGKSHVVSRFAKVITHRDKGKYITAEDAYLNCAKAKIDKIYRILLKALPHNAGLQFLKKLTNRSHMQFEAQNRFLAKWGKSFEAFLSSPVFDKMTVDDREIRISVFLHAAAFFECINDSVSEKQSVFFDEAFVQKAFIFISHLIDCKINESGLFSYLELIPLSDIIIHVKADVNTCCERMLSRRRGLIRLLDGSEKKDVLEFLKTADNNMNSIVHWLKNREDIILIEIDNEDDLNKTIIDLECKIRPFI